MKTNSIIEFDNKLFKVFDIYYFNHSTKYYIEDTEKQNKYFIEQLSDKSYFLYEIHNHIDFDVIDHKIIKYKDQLLKNTHPDFKFVSTSLINTCGTIFENYIYDYGEIPYKKFKNDDMIVELYGWFCLVGIRKNIKIYEE